MVDCEGVYGGSGEIGGLEIGLGTPDKEDVKQSGHLTIKDKAGEPKIDIDGEKGSVAFRKWFTDEAAPRQRTAAL